MFFVKVDDKDWNEIDRHGPYLTKKIAAHSAIWIAVGLGSNLHNKKITVMATDDDGREYPIKYIVPEPIPSNGDGDE